MAGNLTALLAQGIQQAQSTLDHAGPAARDIARLSWTVYIVFGIVTVAMWVLIWWLALRRRGTLREHAPVLPDRGQPWIWIGGIAIPFVVLFAIFIMSESTMAKFPINHSADTDTLIRLTAHQWWWELEYVSGPVNERFETANEIHIPVGRPVNIELKSADVIHSFWVPELHGKFDVIPGTTNRIRIQADREGTFRGECAEFCGEQHAHMILLVVAQDADDFDAWMRAQRAHASEPNTAAEFRGKELFVTGACGMCHTISGTDAHGNVGPDLTHMAGRRGIAANALENNTANLAAWVTHAQSLKPGAKMPDLAQYSGEDLRSIVAYLQHLR